MRSITTNWNNSAYNSAGTFVDVISGNTQPFTRGAVFLSIRLVGIKTEERT